MPETFCIDCWRSRFFSADGELLSSNEVAQLLKSLAEKNFDVTQTQYLFNFDGKAGYTLTAE